MNGKSEIVIRVAATANSYLACIATNALSATVTAVYESREGLPSESIEYDEREQPTRFTSKCRESLSSYILFTL